MLEIVNGEELFAIVGEAKCPLRPSIASMATEPIAFELSFRAKLVLITTASLAVTSLGQTSAPPSSSSHGRKMNFRIASDLRGSLKKRGFQ
jgi:hypothetical protein